MDEQRAIDSHVFFVSTGSKSYQTLTASSESRGAQKSYAMKDCEKNVEIHDIEEFLKWVQTMHMSEDYTQEGGTPPMPQRKLYFRGQADKSWDLIPSLFRKTNANVIERDILKHANINLWNEVHGFSSQLEKLVYFQHYGLCTRLLDVSFNPLIALYMACSEQSNESGFGAIYSGYKDCSQMPVVAELSADFLFNSANDDISYFLQMNGKIEVTRHIDAFSAPIFILPPIIDSRIEVQDGAFIMFPLLDESGAYRKHTINLIEKDFFDRRRAIVPDDCKSDIIRRLAEIGINCGTVYRDTASKIKAIMI